MTKVKKIEEKKPPKEPPGLLASVSAAAREESAGFDNKIPPDLRGNQPPQYPQQAIRDGIEGTVLLRMTINRSGQVTLVEIAKSSGHTLLDQAAVAAVREWEVGPAMVGNEPVETTELLPVEFRL